MVRRVGLSGWSGPIGGRVFAALLHEPAPAEPVPGALLFYAPTAYESGRANSPILLRTLQARTDSVRCAPGPRDRNRGPLIVL